MGSYPLYMCAVYTGMKFHAMRKGTNLDTRMLHENLTAHRLIRGSSSKVKYSHLDFVSRASDDRPLKDTSAFNHRVFEGLGSSR